MSATVIAKFVQAPGESSTSEIDQLSDRELEILELIGKGNEVRQIAKNLHLSPKTVETHRAHIKEKLNLANARQVGRFAVQWLAQRDV
jgi:DNA-binding NarL/FixJ family response regulator